MLAEKLKLVLSHVHPQAPQKPTGIKIFIVFGCLYYKYRAQSKPVIVQDKTNILKCNSVSSKSSLFLISNVKFPG